MANTNFSKLVENLKLTANGVTFVGINYTNQQGEKSNYLINIGASYENAKKKDLETLQNLDVKNIKNYKGLDSESITVLNEAKKALISALIKPNKTQSQAQKDAYTHLINGMKIHNDTYDLFVFGFKVKKTIQIKGDYKQTDYTYEGAKPLTRAKNYLRVEFMKSTKYRQFKISKNQLHTLKMSGDTITFDLD